MTIDDSICKNCLKKNNCHVLPYSDNCNELRAISERDKEVYNKAIDDFADKLLYQIGDLDIRDIIQETAEQLKAGGENE